MSTVGAATTIITIGGDDEDDDLNATNDICILSSICRGLVYSYYCERGLFTVAQDSTSRHPTIVGAAIPVPSILCLRGSSLCEAAYMCAAAVLPHCSIISMCSRRLHGAFYEPVNAEQLAPIRKILRRQLKTNSRKLHQVMHDDACT